MQCCNSCYNNKVLWNHNYVGAMELSKDRNEEVSGKGVLATLGCVPNISSDKEHASSGSTILGMCLSH